MEGGQKTFPHLNRRKKNEKEVWKMVKERRQDNSKRKASQQFSRWNW